MSDNALVANPGRFRILTSLAAGGRQEFVSLRARTRLTDGNLAAHAKRLSAAGMIEVDKQFRGGKPVTSFALTRAGREALESHAVELLEAIGARLPDGMAVASPSVPTPRFLPSPPEPTSADEDWID